MRIRKEKRPRDWPLGLWISWIWAWGGNRKGKAKTPTIRRKAEQRGVPALSKEKLMKMMWWVCQILGVDQDDGWELAITFSSLEVIGGLHENCFGGMMEKMLVWSLKQSGTADKYKWLLKNFWCKMKINRRTVVKRTLGLLFLFLVLDGWNSSIFSAGTDLVESKNEWYWEENCLHVMQVGKEDLQERLLFYAHGHSISVAEGRPSGHRFWQVGRDGSDSMLKLFF